MVARDTSGRRILPAGRTILPRHQHGQGRRRSSAITQWMESIVRRTVLAAEPRPPRRATSPSTSASRSSTFRPARPSAPSRPFLASSIHRIATPRLSRCRSAAPSKDRAVPRRASSETSPATTAPASARAMTATCSSSRGPKIASTSSTTAPSIRAARSTRLPRALGHVEGLRPARPR